MEVVGSILLLAYMVVGGCYGIVWAAREAAPEDPVVGIGVAVIVAFIWPLVALLRMAREKPFWPPPLNRRKAD
jgi:hypothetical protein